ncbi:MAG: arsenate reductase ArsC [Candidatus Melainabacteria bacterium]|nr:MAG: arsenate reductase ArsC [Candidatus Melainabacteria bacterium]
MQLKVLFICIENSCRSQIAEGFGRRLGLEAESAGIKAGAGVNPDAVKVMDEIGVDISKQYSKAIDNEKLGNYDAIISMCSVKTADFCPSTFIGTQANWNVEDPKGQPLDVFRRVRDEIKSKVEELAKEKCPSKS